MAGRLSACVMFTLLLFSVCLVADEEKTANVNGMQQGMQSHADIQAALTQDMQDTSDAMMIGEIVSREAGEKDTVRFWNKQIDIIQNQINFADVSQEKIDELYPRLLYEMLQAQQNIDNVFDDWHQREVQREVLHHLLTARSELWPLLSVQYRDILTGYSAVAVKVARHEVQFVQRQYYLYTKWLVKWWQKNKYDWQVSPLPLIAVVLQCIAVMAMFILWIRYTSAEQQKHTLPFILSIPGGHIWMWIVAVRWQLGLMAFTYINAVVLQSIFDLTIIMNAAKILTAIIAAYLVTGILHYYFTMATEIKHMNEKSYKKIQGMYKTIIISLVIIYCIEYAGDVILGGGTLTSWCMQGIKLYIYVYVFIQLYLCNPMLQECLRTSMPKRYRWKGFIKDARFLRCMASLAIILLLLEQYVRNKLQDNESARRVMAYLSRKKMQRVSGKEEGSMDAFQLAGDDLVPTLLPDYEPESFVEYSDAVLQIANTHVFADKKIIVAVVGARGIGKTTFLRRLMLQKGDGIKYLQCPANADNIYKELAELFGVKDCVDKSQFLTILKKYPKTIVCLDDCQRLMVPAIGGLKLFEDLLDIIRQAGGSVSWVMSCETPAWQFFKRVRGERIIFDGIYQMPHWSESQISQLIQQRNKIANIAPDFSKLFFHSDMDISLDEDGETLADDELKETHEEARLNIIRQQAHAKAYVRVLWDYSGGNPRIALWAWRNSLFIEHDSSVLFVGLFKNVNALELDELPELMLFVLKTINQLEVASVDNVVQATNLTFVEVQDALRFLVVRNYVVRKDGNYTICSDWLRPIIVLLVRKHLLQEGV